MGKTNKRLKSRRQREHGSEHTLGHQLDKAAGDTRKQEVWIYLGDSDVPIKDRNYGKVEGIDMIPVNGELTSVSATEYMQHIEAENIAKNHYYGDKRRGDRITQCRLKYNSPIFETTITLSPWHSEAFEVECQVDPQNASRLLQKWSTDMAAEFELKTGREVVAVTSHLDTNIPHINIFHSRIQKDEHGVNRLCGDKHLGLVGPWTVGVYRQQQAGIVNVNNDLKYEQNLEKFRSRKHSSKLPLDIHLAGFLDGLCEREFGPAVEQLKTNYKRKTQQKHNLNLYRLRSDLQKQIGRVERALDQSYDIENEPQPSR